MASSLLETVFVGDAFCGAGGSSTGAQLALEELGLRMKLAAINHWDVAIKTHALNHPDALHARADIYRTDPRTLVPGGRLDLLMASPTCVFFSRARGGRPISWDQRWGRMTPTQVLRWCDELDVRRLLVENVPEFRDWGPVHRGPKVDEDGEEIEPAPPVRNRRCLRGKKCRPGKPCARAKGAYFRAFLRRLTALGFIHEHRVLCAADYGDPTTRERFFLIATREHAEGIAWPAPTHAEHGAIDLFGGELPRWRAARECIDFSIRGKSIFTRRKRLSKKTLERIYAGLVRYRWPRPFLLKLRAYIDKKKTPTFTAADLEGWLPESFVARSGMHSSHAGCTRRLDDPIATVTTEGGIAIATPFVDVLRANAKGASLDAPMRTVCAGGGHLALVEPFVVGNRAHNVPTTGPVPTITTAHGGGVGFVEPLLVPQGGGGLARGVSAPAPTLATDGAVGLVVPYYGTGVARDLAAPLPTVTTRDRFAFVTPVTHTDASCRARPLDAPLPSVTAAHRGELAFIAAAFGEREGQAPRTHSIDDPAPSICATGRVNLVQGDPIDVDILYRMLEPHELALAMGFPPGYRFHSRKKEDLTRQIGNAVAVNTARALVLAIFANRAATRRTKVGAA